MLRLALVKVPHTQILSSRLDFSESELGLKNHLLLISAQVPLVVTNIKQPPSLLSHRNAFKRNPGDSLSNQVKFTVD